MREQEKEKKRNKEKYEKNVGSLNANAIWKKMKKMEREEIYLNKCSNSLRPCQNDHINKLYSASSPSQFYDRTAERYLRIKLILLLNRIGSEFM